MKTKSLLTAALALSFGIFFAQGEKVPQPDFNNVPCYYIKGTVELKSFTKAVPTMKPKMNKADYELSGPNDLVRIKTTEDYIMIIKAGDNDPSTITFLFKLISSKKNRSANAMTNSGVLTDNVKTNKDQLPYSLVKLEDKVFKIVPETKLAPGEYMFLVGGTAYSFGVD